MNKVKITDVKQLEDGQEYLLEVIDPSISHVFATGIVDETTNSFRFIPRGRDEGGDIIIEVTTGLLKELHQYIPNSIETMESYNFQVFSIHTPIKAG